MMRRAFFHSSGAKADMAAVCVDPRAGHGQRGFERVGKAPGTAAFAADENDGVRFAGR